MQRDPEGYGLIGVCPHSEDLDRLLLAQNLIDEAMLNVDSPRERSFEVSDELLVARRTLVGVGREELE